MFQISEIVKKTEEMFDLFNKHFYNKELTRPAITVSPDGGRGAYGWCSIHEIWNADEEKYREINSVIFLHIILWQIPQISTAFSDNLA